MEFPEYQIGVGGRPMAPLQLFVEEAIDWRDTCAEHRRAQKSSARRFAEHVSERFGVQTYDQLQAKHVANAFRNFERDGLSPAYIRHIGNTLRVADSYAQLFGEHKPIAVKDYLPNRQKKPKEYLSPEQLFAAIEFARSISDGAGSSPVSRSRNRGVLGETVITVAGLSGLRLTEIMRLQPEDVKDGLIWIRHRTKNASSRRVIPVLPIVSRAMNRWFSRRYKGHSYECIESFSSAARTVLHGVTKKKQKRRYLIAPHDAGRKTFANICRVAGVDNMALKGYLGHSFSGFGFMLESAYIDYVPHPEGMEEIRAEAIENLRREVLDPLGNFLRGKGFDVD